MRHPATSVLNALTFLPQRRIDLTPARVDLPYEDLYFTAADGVRVNGWFVRANNPVGHILFAHGNAGNIGDRTPILALLAAAGFDVLVFDYRGFGRSEGRPSEAGCYLDARAARAALLERPGVASDRIFYLGKSLGGGVVIELATEFAPAGLIVMSSFTGLREAACEIYPFLPKPLVPDAFPSLRRIRTLRTPTLIMHGDADELLPVRMGRALHDAASDPTTLQIYPGAGHNDLVTTPGWAATVSAWARAVLAGTATAPGQ